MTKFKSAAANRLLTAAGTQDVLEAVRTIAAALLRETECPPTDLVTIAARLNAKLSAADIFGSGELRRSGGDYEIVYAADLSVPRRRFTIAHELAHVVIDQTGPNAPRTGQELERLCDLIAVELLMPERIFRAHLPAELHMADVFALATRFQTSLVATAHRCAELARSTVFEVVNEKLTWSCGPLRRSAALRDEDLMEHMRRAASGQSALTVLYLNDDSSIRPVRVEYHAFGNTGRALFLLTNTSMSEAERVLQAHAG
ncbi:MAG: ImmA/IrrE family metallo-endopeptidase [Bryobacteraceae bacterium]|jgi:hypothetical protein